MTGRCRSRWNFIVATAAIVVVCLAGGSARAAVDRYAVLAGNNLGASDEARLRYAEADAVRVYDVLKDLGGFPPENLILLRGEGTTTMRNAIIATNDRVRQSVAAGREAVLVVYYSGHANAEALHLGDETFPLRELEQLARGSAATLRLLVLDACRSGAVTQTKGGRPDEPFPVRLEQRLAGEGAIFLTSSAINEESQESDAISGSFFTHYFVSGLLGSADQNGDGNVTLEESYRFTYDNTVRASSRTLAGVQHPSFRFELSGHGGFVLVSPFRKAGRAQVYFPDNITFLVVSDSADGAVTAEVNATDRMRRLSLKPGRYFLRGRTRHYLLEGTLQMAADQVVTVDPGTLTRVEYARLVRKGGQADRAFSLEVAYRVTTPIKSGASPCHGAVAGTSMALPRLTLGAQLGFCRSRREDGMETATARGFSATADRFDAVIHAGLDWDLPVVTLGLGLHAGLAVFHESFATAGQAPPRWISAGVLGVASRGTFAIRGRSFVFLELTLDTMLTRMDESPQGSPKMGAKVIGQGLVGVGTHLNLGL